MAPPIPLAYTFGNHMHWVDMEWLWGYDVLPGSTDDMLAICRECGVKGGVNFDGIGYEKMASESPEHLAKLRAAIAEGTIEVIGGSYGQPYGLFHGGESNIRQLVYGVRASMRLLGARPMTFWEEEFDFFPQLPQILADCGYTGASLYFQWTWHTPEIPMEDAPVVAWEGIDGTRLPTATRNRMNLHQWPEDFRALLDDLASNPPDSNDGTPPPLVLQWLELMPTADWMCRSELMAPMLKELKGDPRFELIALTLGEYLAQWKEVELPVRRYSMDEVWHGMTLGKNGDRHPKKSAELEHRLLEAETAAAILGLFGRPYEPWDVYPTWELEECWRNLLAAQHHDNHECEGLCGHVAEAQFAFVDALLAQSDPAERLAKRVGVADGEEFAFNRHGWKVGGDVPSMGYRVGRSSDRKGAWKLENDVATFESAGMRVQIDAKTGSIIELTTELGTMKNLNPTFKFGPNHGGVFEASTKKHWPAQVEEDHLVIHVGPNNFICLRLRPIAKSQELEISISVETEWLPEPLGPGYANAVRIHWPIAVEIATIRTDGPYSVQTVGAGSSGKRKYPEGDWMTSPQWFESVQGAFISQSFVDVSQLNGSGLLISHSGSQQWFRTESGLDTVALAIDPWDGNKHLNSVVTTFRLCPHNGLENSECVKRAAHVRGQPVWMTSGASSPFRVICGPMEATTETAPLPREFSAVTVHAPNVLATAFYREQESFAGRDLDLYDGKGMGHPYLLRLVEVDGIGGDVEITLPGPIARAARTNLMGEAIEELVVQEDDDYWLTSEPDSLEPFGIRAVRLKLAMRPFEIATIYLDIVPGRKQFRDLDAKREIWAIVHRVDG